MFCKNCGANLPDNARFCTTCGAVVSEGVPAAAQPAPVYAPAQPNPMVTKFVSALKGFWTKPIATVGDSAKSTTHEWVLFAIAGVLSYALGTAVVGLEMISQILKEMLGPLAGSFDAGNLYPFFAIFGIGILIGAVAYFGMALGIWVFIAKILKKNASLVSVLNMTAVACLPLTAMNILNMLIGLVYSPLTIVFFLAAFAMVVVCLYTGTQKLDKLDKSPFYGFSIVLAIVILASCLLGMLYFTAIINALEAFAMSAVSGVLGGLGGMYDFF